MPRMAYWVVATFPDSRTADEYVEWLRSGHLDAVIRGGAESGNIVRVQDPSEPVRVETRYVFASAQAYARYVSTAAPALRAEGLRLFGPERKIRFERGLGEIVSERAAPGSA